MVQKAPGRKTYRTANGKSIDLDQLIQRNELTPAVGNARVNARGDELGPGGKIIRKREDVLRDYYQSSPTVPDENVTQKTTETVSKSIIQTPAAEPAAKPTEQEAKQLEEFDEGWEEDEDGNFTKKGDK
jgi:hypothetical protein